MSEDLVRYRVEDGVAVLTLNNPPANAYSHEMMCQLDTCILRARFDDDVHVMVLTGEGDRFFCAGADIGMLEDVEPTFKYYFCLHANETLCRLEQTPKLVIAALNGHCVGGGLEVALACDIRLARAGGGKCGVPEVRLGVLPGTGGTQRLSRLVGKSRALRLMAEGESFSFEDGVDWGLIDEVLPSDDFDLQVLKFAGRFKPPGAASKAVGLIKRACQSGPEMGFEQGLALERELQQQLFLSEDAAEGLRAFREKRPPEFRGR